MDNLLNPQSREERQIEKEKKYRGLGTIRKKKGLSMWSLNAVSGEVSKCELIAEKTAVVTGRNSAIGIKKYALVVSPDTHYAQALNKKSAMRKFNKLVLSGAILCEAEIH